MSLLQQAFVLSPNLSFALILLVFCCISFAYFPNHLFGYGKSNPKVIEAIVSKLLCLEPNLSSSFWNFENKKRASIEMVAFNYRGGNKQERNFRIIFSLPEFSSICNTRRYWSLPKYEYCRYRKILGNTGNTSIADTGRFWKILVIPVLQILEDSEKYW